MTLANNVVAKFAVAFVAIAMMFSVVAPASAQNVDDMSLEELIALVTQLQGQLGSDDMSGDMAGSCGYTWTRNLNMGDTGADVMELQKFLNSMSETQVAPAGSAGGPGSETSYYGPATGAAVANFQMKYRAEILSPLGLVNPTTFFGNSTRAQANAVCAGMGDMMDDDMGDDDMMDDDDDDSSSASLGNDEGDIDNVDSTSADDSNINEGELGAIFAFELEIDGDVEVDRVDLFLEVDNNAGVSNDADDYFTEAQLWVDGEEVASLDVDEFDDDDYNTFVTGTTNDDEFRLRFTNLGLVFEDEDEPEFVLGLVAANNIDSADLSADWIAALPVDAIRFVDGEGFTGEAPTAALSDSFGFDEEETAELQLSESSDNPDASTLEVDKDDQTDDVEVMVFEIEEENGVDVTIDEIRATIVALSSTSAALAEDVVIASARIMNGSDELASENVPSTGIVDFENMDLEIDADGSVELSIELTFEDADDVNVAYDDGTTVQITAISIQEADDENGNDEGDMTISGSPDSNVHTLREDGLSVSLKSEDTTAVENDDQTNADDEGEFELVFEVTAFGDDVYLPFGASATTDLTSGFEFSILDNNNAVVATTTGFTVSVDVADGDAEETNSYKVNEGSTEEFTLGITFNPGSADSYKVRLDTINFASSDVATATEAQDVSDQDIDTAKLTIQD